MAQYVLQPATKSGLTTDLPWDYSMGIAFTPQKTGSVTKLGGFFSGTKTVALYNSSYTLIASASVTSSYAWSYTAITPVTVTQGQRYYVVVYCASSGGAYYSTCTLFQTVGDVIIDYRAYQPPSGTFNASHGSYLYNVAGMADVEITFNNPPQVNIGGVWKNSPSQSVNIGGTWKNINGIFVNIGGIWKPV